MLQLLDSMQPEQIVQNLDHQNNKYQKLIGQELQNPFHFEIRTPL